MKTENHAMESFIHLGYGGARSNDGGMRLEQRKQRG